MNLMNLDSQQCRQTDPTGILVSQACSLLICSLEELTAHGYARLEFIYRFAEILKLTNIMRITSVALQAHVQMTRRKPNHAENFKLLHDALELLLISLQNDSGDATTGALLDAKFSALNAEFNNANPIDTLIALNDSNEFHGLE